MDILNKLDSNRKLKLRGNQTIWVIVLTISLISIVAAYSSTAALAIAEKMNNSFYLFKQIGFVFVGLAALFICYYTNVKVYRIISILILPIAWGFLSFVAIRSMIDEGNARWIDLGFMTFQPSELAKVAVVLYLARAIEIFNLENFKDYALKIIVPLGITCVLTLWGSVTSTLIIAFISSLLLIFSGIKWMHLLKTLLIVLAGLAFIYLIHKTTGAFDRVATFEARVERFFTGDNIENLDALEQQQYKDKNFQSQQAIKAIQVGGLWGVGIGEGIVKNILPNPYDDFIFTTILEETGLLGGILVMLLYLWFLFCCVKITHQCSTIYTVLTVLGLGILICTQAMIHILVNIGIFPVTGQTLPLISSGGTSFLVMSSAIGIVLSINKTIEINMDGKTQLGNEK